MIAAQAAQYAAHVKSHTVVPGDTLSGIAAWTCGSSRDWPAIWHQNRREIPDPDLIYPGMVLRYSCTGVQTVAAVAPVQPAAVSPVQDAPVPSAAVTGLSGTLTCAGLEELWVQAGGAPGEAFMAAEIAMAESGGNQYALSPTDDYGYWQINGSHGPAQATFSALGNAEAAVAISADGTDWTPWTTYNTGAYAGRC